MTKLKTPLLSFDARGNLGRAIAFIKRRGHHIAERIPTPTDAKSTEQLFQRTMFTQCKDLWHTLAAAEKQLWESNARPHHMTGYAFWMSSCLLPNPGIYLPLLGGTMQGNINMDSHALTNLLDPTANQDADTKQARNVAITAHAALFNLHPKLILKTATESIVSDTNFKSDAHLKFSVLANEVWQFLLYLRHNRTAGGAQSSKIIFTIPAGSSLPHMTAFGGTNEGDGAASFSIPQYDVPIVRVRTHFYLYIGGANAGTVQLQWAQAVSEIYTHYFLINSYIIAHRLL